MSCFVIVQRVLSVHCQTRVIGPDFVQIWNTIPHKIAGVPKLLMQTIQKGRGNDYNTMIFKHFGEFCARVLEKICMTLNEIFVYR
jgi:hypothetical protein